MFTGKSFPQVADVSINNKKYTLYFRYNEDVWTIPEIVKMKENGLITDYSRKPWGDPVGYQVGGMHYYMNYKCCEPDGLAGAGKYSSFLYIFTAFYTFKSLTVLQVVLVVIVEKQNLLHWKAVAYQKLTFTTEKMGQMEQM